MTNIFHEINNNKGKPIKTPIEEAEVLFLEHRQNIDKISTTQ